MVNKFSALTVRRRHSPIVGDWAADEEKRQLGNDKTESNIGGDVVNPLSLLQALTDEDKLVQGQRK